jgi:hypothetical protein
MGAYGTLNILAYNAYLNGTDEGVEIKLGLNNITGYKNLNWVQVITTNSPYSFSPYPSFSTLQIISNYNSTH